MPGVTAVLLFVLCTSAYQWKTHAFTYIGNVGITNAIYRRSGSDVCKICLDGNECLEFNPVTCEYYIETSKVLKKDEEPADVNNNPQLRAEVDSLIFTVIERAKSEKLIKECIPFVSTYTDCTKDNICLGCKTCDCNEGGQWNCTITQNCRPELISLAADRRTIYNVLRALKKSPTETRLKRSIFHTARSLEDMDKEEELNYSHYNKDNRLNRWDYGAPAVEPDNKYIFYQNRGNYNPTTTERNNEGKKELIKLIVKSLIKDTLPDIFKANSLDFENNRVKRWIYKNSTVMSSSNGSNLYTTTNMPITQTLKNKITFEELSDWLNEMHPLIYAEEANAIIVKNITGYETSTTGDDTDENPIQANLPPDNTHTITTEGTTLPNPEYIAFEEVYDNIQVDNKSYVRRKPPLDHDLKYAGYDREFNMYDDKYYTDNAETTPTDYSVVDDIVDKIVVTATTETAVSDFIDDVTEYIPHQSATKIIVDLLGNASDFDNKENQELNDNKIDSLDKLDANNIVNIMKRDVSSDNEHEQSNSTSIEINSTNAINSNEIPFNTSIQNVTIRSPLEYLKVDILNPIEKLLKNKQQEIKEIIEIRQRLIKFIQLYTNHTNFNVSGNNSIYDPADVPHHHHKSLNFRRSNISMIDKYKFKLKHDIYEVIKDILGIKQLYNKSSKFPTELNFLIRSLKHYVHWTGFPLKTRSTRRNYYSSTSNVKNVIILIFELLSKNIHDSDTLDPLSPHSRRIIKRFIKKNYVDDFAASGLRIYDPHYNLTNDLKSIGSQWQIMTSIIDNSPIFNRLYNLKRFHLLISIDMAKMNDALALIQFASNRRMVPVNEVDAKEIVTNINKNLSKIRNQIETFSNTTLIQINRSSLDENITKKHKKKDSFMVQIKKLLKKSKQDILKLLRRKVPKTDIVKHIARKHIEEMTKQKLQNTMEKWQTDLNIIPMRNKRSIKDYDKIHSRIANIIPKYLRGKVHPMVSKNSKLKQDKSMKLDVGNGNMKKLSEPKKSNDMKKLVTEPKKNKDIKKLSTAPLLMKKTTQSKAAAQPKAAAHSKTSAQSKAAVQSKPAAHSKASAQSKAAAQSKPAAHSKASAQSKAAVQSKPAAHSKASAQSKAAAQSKPAVKHNKPIQKVIKHNNIRKQSHTKNKKSNG